MLLVILAIETLKNFLSNWGLVGVNGIHDNIACKHTHTRILTHVHVVVDLRSSLANFMMTHPFPVASKLPIKTLVAR